MPESVPSAALVGAVLVGAVFAGAAFAGAVLAGAPCTSMNRLGLIGTFVWDTIYGRDPLTPAVEEWGG
ncbi:MAG: hypothetical protein KGN74_08300, partial [Gemmatimonadota bacterium]|nr:hypothetical protein [Gemmatimonadota bacterium]